MKLLKTFIISLFLISFCNLVFSQELSTLGIMDVVPREGVSEASASIITDIFFDTVFNLGSNKYNIIDREMRDTLLLEHQFAISDLCDEVNCAIEAGKYLSADYMLISNFAKLGTYYYITSKIVNVNTALVESSSRAKTEDLDNIEEAINIGVSELLNVGLPEMNELVIQKIDTERLKKILKLKPEDVYIDKIPKNDRISLYNRAKKSKINWFFIGTMSGCAAFLGAVFAISGILTDREEASGSEDFQGWIISGSIVFIGATPICLLGLVKSTRSQNWMIQLEPYI